MCSKRFIKLVRKLGNKNLPDWMILAYWIYTIRNYPDSLLVIEMAEHKDKFIGD